MTAAPVGFSRYRIGGRVAAALVGIVLLVAIVPRLIGICGGSLHADEKHWDERAHGIIENLKSDPLRVTSHLAHPGVVPAFIMATGQVLASRYNILTGAQPSDDRFLDTLSGARIANAVFSSLLPVLLLLVLLSWTGPAEAFCLALVLALSPRFIDLSRIAHVDTIHGVFVCATVFLYLRSLQCGDRRWTFFAGVGFGLCLLCKPTSIALIPGLFMGKVLLARMWPQQFTQRWASWSDVWLAVTALAVFVLLYSRMWHHGELFPQWRAVSHAGPHVLYRIGRQLGSDAFGSLSVLGLGAVLVWQGYSARRRELQPWYWHCATLAVVLLLSLTLFPAVWENLVRYWMRVFNLTSVKHESFAGAVAPPVGGYLTLMLVELPPLVLMGTVLSPLCLLRPLRASLKPSEQQLMLLSAVVFLVWMMFLSSSAKQSYRYIMAVVPFVYIVGCFTLFAVGRIAGKAVVPIAALITLQSVSAIATYPQWDLYQSAFARLVSPSLRLELLRPRSGQHDVLAVLREEAAKRGHPLFVTVLGDGDVMAKEAARNSISSQGRVSMWFGYFPEYSADFLLVQDYLKREDSLWSKHLEAGPRFQYRSNGLTLLSLYEVKPENGPPEVTLPVNRLQALPGTRTNEGGRAQIVLKPGVTKAGYALVIPGGVRVAAGRHRVEFTCSAEVSALADMPDNAPAARFEITRSCARVVVAGEYRKGLDRIALNCELPDARRITPHVYWFGKVPLRLGDISITRETPAK